MEFENGKCESVAAGFSCYTRERERARERERERETGRERGMPR